MAKEKPEAKKKNKTLEAPKKVGRPTHYNQEFGNRICELIATSPFGTNKLCKMYDWMPNEDTIYQWRYKHALFAEKYALAKSKQAEIMVEQIVDISDDITKDFYHDDNGNARVDAGAVAHRRLQVDTRKWYASKLAPKIYGDKLALEKKEDENAELIAEIKMLRAKLDEKNKKDY